MPATVNAAIGPIAEAVIATHRLDADVLFCQKVLGWSAVADEAVPAAAAARWGATAATGARSVAVRPPRGAPGGGVRFVEAALRTDPVRPLTTYGWAAVEILVADVDSLAASVDAAGVDVLGRPGSVGSNDGDTARLRAMQIALPGGAAVYLTEVRVAPPGFELPSIERGVAGVFIVVLASPDLELTRGFLESRFGLRRVTDHPLQVRVLNRAFRLPPASLHRVSSLQLAGASAIEIDQYPPVARHRPAGAGELPHGVAVVEVHARDLASVRPGLVEGPYGIRLAVVPPAGAARPGA